MRTVPADCVIFGEIGLSGEVRGVAGPEARLKEAAKLGFKHALGPKKRRLDDVRDIMSTDSISHAKDLVTWLNDPYLHATPASSLGSRA